MPLYSWSKLFIDIAGYEKCTRILKMVHPSFSPVQLPVVDVRGHDEEYDGAEQGQGRVQDALVGHLNKYQHG